VFILTVSHECTLSNITKLQLVSVATQDVLLVPLSCHLVMSGNLVIMFELLWCCVAQRGDDNREVKGGRRSGRAAGAIRGSWRRPLEMLLVVYKEM
jgi:hypothetical protein